MIIFYQLLKSLCLFYGGGAGSDSTASSLAFLSFLHCVNAEQFKGEWDYLPSAINATLSLGSREPASVERASCSSLCVGQVREKGWAGVGDTS